MASRESLPVAQNATGRTSRSRSASTSTNPTRAKTLRPKPGMSKYWQNLIRKELKSPGDAVQDEPGNPHKPWDPQKKLYTSTVPDFFSGHEMRPHEDYLIDRERFAHWAIWEAIQDTIPGKYQITGDIEHGLVPRHIIEAIGEDGQKDIDAEVSRDASNANKHSQDEFTKRINTTAQAFLSSSPHSRGPPILAAATYLQMEKCGTYNSRGGRKWESPSLFPEIKGATTDTTKGGFYDNQITGITWLLGRLLGELPKLKDNETPEEAENRARLRGPQYSGGILSDSMGLGKTLTVIGCLSLMAKRGLNAPVVNPATGKRKHYPILILPPNATVGAQWVEELCRSTNRDSIEMIIAAGGSRSLYVQEPRDRRVHHMAIAEFEEEEWPAALDHIWDSENPNASKTVIVVALDSFVSRTCKAEDVETLDKNGNMTERIEWFSSYTEMGRKFSVIVVDEAHRIKNAATKLWKGVNLLERLMVILVTATPCLNTLTDLHALARLLWKVPEQRLKEDSDTWEDVNAIETWAQLDEKLQDVPIWDDLNLVAGRSSLLATLICKNRGQRDSDVQKTRDYLRYFETLAILRRGPGSELPLAWDSDATVPLKGLLPRVKNFSVNIQQNKSLASGYGIVHAKILIKYCQCLQAWNKQKKKPTAQKANTPSITWAYRTFQIASASIDVYHLDYLLMQNGFGTTAEDIAQMRANRVTFPRLAHFMLLENDPEPTKAIDYIKLAVRKSPILRYILHDIRKHLLIREPNANIKKLLITEAVPILAYYYELVLQFLGLNCRALHASLSQDERKELIKDFNESDRNSCQIMIQPYTVGYAGTNLQKNCWRVLVASQAHSMAVQQQAVHRVIRIGQSRDVEVYRLKVDNTFHSFRESRQTEKYMPELAPRATGDMNTQLVELLNIFQYEVDEAWKSEEGKDLIRKKILTSTWKSPTGASTEQPEEAAFPPHKDEPPLKRQRVDNGTEESNVKKEQTPVPTSATWYGNGMEFFWSCLLGPGAP